MGAGKFLKEYNSNIKIIATAPHPDEKVQGLRAIEHGFIPPIIDLEKNTIPDIRTKRIMKPIPTDKITFNELFTFCLNLLFPSSPFIYSAKYTGSITIPHGYTDANVDVIEYVTIATQGNGVDFGNLQSSTYSGAATSNAHGGL